MTMAAGDFWIITSYFNPARYRRRNLNYALFRQRLPLPLLTVELATPEGFELGPDDADCLVQLPAFSTVWQKERLLNIAQRSLPPSVKFVAWLDCDVMFSDDRWPAEAVETLKSASLVQLFSRLYDFGPDQKEPSDLGTDVDPTGCSIAYLHATETHQSHDLRPRNTQDMRTAAYGLAWAARRELLSTHGFYDRMVMGSGDRALACAALNRPQDAIQTLHLNDARAGHYLRWADAFYKVVRGSVSHLDRNLYHLWHGDITHRRYAERHIEFARLDFDPARDLDPADDLPLRWSPRRPELEEFSQAYFRGRREDG